MKMSEDVKAWCRAECERQHATTENDFANMEAAWIAAADGEQTVTANVIRGLAELVDPIANPGGQYRTGPAVFMNGGTALNARMITRAVYYLTTENDLTPQEFYRELMYIHPFKDGNGRVGALVYNMLNGTINNPVVPPEYR